MDYREIDILVAEKVLGWVVCTSPSDIPSGYTALSRFSLPAYLDGTYVFDLPHFSTKIGDAWIVIEELYRSGWWAGLWRCAGFGTLRQDWECKFEHADRGETAFHYCHGHGPPDNVTAPMAVCLAALQTAGINLDTSLITM